MRHLLRIIPLLAAASALSAQQAPAKAPPRGQSAPAALRAEVEALNAAMVAAFKRDPASVARFYADDATIVGGGARSEGRAEIDRYWAAITGFADWTLEVLEVGGSRDAPWQHGRSVLTGRDGRTQAVEFLGVMKRDRGGRLRFYIDMYVPARR